MAWSLRWSRSGRILIGARDNGRALQSYGVNLARTRLAAFAMAGFLAAIAGGLFAYLQGAVDAGVFVPSVSIEVFAMAVVGGLTSIGGAVAGAAYVIGFRYFLRDYQLLATGAGMLVLLLALPGGFAELGLRGRDAFLRWVARRHDLHVPSLFADTPDANAHREADSERAHASESETHALLACTGVDVAYDKVQILFDVDFFVRPNEIVALLGTNGAGKSTLLRAISGLVRPKAGRIVFDGNELRGADPLAAVGLGIVQVPGGRGVFPTLTVAENLKVAAWQFRGERAHVEAATANVFERFPRLLERVQYRAGDLSGGEQQMLALGMAFIARPRLLLIDELSLGLAPKVVEELLGIVRAIHEQGTTIVLVEQSVNLALTLADRAYFMEKGAIRFSGPTAELLERDDILRAVFLQGAASVNGGAAKQRRRVPLVARAAGGNGHVAPPVLEVSGLTKHFGGIVAVDHVGLQLHRGETLGLIGHNGAGKTTVFDLISGFLIADDGRVVLNGVDVTSWTPDRRAAAGLGRSFQDARLFPSLTVAENLALGLERHLDGRDHLAAALHLPAVVEVEEDVSWTVGDLTELMNLGRYRGTPVGELSTGTRRIVDLAMAIAHDPEVLILDEPSAGIAQRETEALGPVLRRIQKETSCSLLIIEHDMPLIQRVSDRLVALETGRVIAEGAPSVVVRDPRVIESYLGTDTSSIHRSGEVVRR
jgi:branched-chain amino acid transport system ATP-binding protein